MQVASHKCFVFSLGNLNIKECTYSLGSHKLAAVNSIRDLGVTMSNNLKFSEHCSKLSAIAYSRVSCLLKCFHSRDPYWLTRVFTTYVRPLLEFNTQVFSPHLKKDITVLERVQKYFTRSVCKRAGLCYNGYASRLRILKLQSIEHRRIIFDLCLMYKIFYGLIDMDFARYFSRRTHNYATRCADHNTCQIVPLVNTDKTTLRSTFFYRVVKYWNFLPDEIVLTLSLSSFKAQLQDIDPSSFCIYY